MVNHVVSGGRFHPPYENDEASYGQVMHMTPREQAQVETALGASFASINLGSVRKELSGLYKLAVTRADALEVAHEALRLANQNRAVLSFKDRAKLDELSGKLANLD